AAEDDAAGVGGEQAGDLVDQRGLAGAVRADHGVQFARADLEMDAVGAGEAAEALVQVVEAQHRLAHGAGLGRNRAPIRSHAPISPPRANSTTSTRNGPKIIFQCSVTPDSHSSISRKTIAPMMAPCRRPSPPSRIMMINSPERCHDM